ncbi:histidine biosynthesis bifunctional protein HisIE [Paenibacillus sp. J31TS4]|uniref:bifunctional phosphoribosyl-AMP cyclohydrolase/phosphoribosyl-ATP diphosphatase HisIE n=1 Tax=Paenibacillus sp. J31TS4 TaxID=2807195 RepID=UPI001B2900B1|nr:bifunctional phosphoribosyl-AMP cyclohydrolase/phosphoribosyl-ATP diphosphatase HisIE [Paenibacillus sp. J31TS4]GIP40273.1 histidine biosynthesis bifunctional protein HisIE [Paenibacillus sp. J31TS4]
MTDSANTAASTNPAAVGEIIRWDGSGLVPAIVQDAASKDVLMMAYMNREAFRLTVESGEAWFWSRSRAELWHKGATSGNVLRVVSLQYDCDADTLLLKVHPAGPACHTGKASCFFGEVALPGRDSTQAQAASGVGEDRFAILSQLESVVAQRDMERPEGAYTTYLFEKGLDKILKKIGEEATEVIIGAKNNDSAELRCEASDLIFHLMVLLRQQKVPLDDVLRELERRHVSKQSAPNKQD